MLFLLLVIQRLVLLTYAVDQDILGEFIRVDCLFCVLLALLSHRVLSCSQIIQRLNLK